MRRTISLLIMPVALAVLLAGCGSGMLKTKGRLLKGGSPVIPAEDEVVRVAFVPMMEGQEKAKDYYMAEFNRTDGSFQVVGKDGKGLPPGKYRIAVEYMKQRRDMLGGAFDHKSSPLVREVTASTGELTLDLSNPKG
jgi:hypothetical protein